MWLHVLIKSRQSKRKSLFEGIVLYRKERTMKKILAILLSLALVFAFVACGGSNEEPAPADEGEAAEEPAETTVEPVNVVMYSPNTGNYAEKALIKMSEVMEEMSGGLLKPVLIDAGTAGYQDEAVQGMMSGDMNLIVNTVDQLENYVPNVGNWMSWPFLFNSDEEASEVWDKGGWMFQRVQEQAAEKGGIHVFIYIYNGWKNLCFKGDVNGFDAWQGLKCRVPATDLFHDLCARYGLQTVSGIDPYTSLQNGTVDSIYFSEEAFQTFKLEEVMKSCVITHDTYGSNLYTCSEAFWQSLAPEQQEALQKIVCEIGDEYNNMSRESAEGEYMDSLPGLGINVYQIDDATKTAMKKATVSFWEEKLADEAYDEDFRNTFREVFEKNYADVL